MSSGTHPSVYHGITAPRTSSSLSLFAQRSLPQYPQRVPTCPTPCGVTRRWGRYEAVAVRWYRQRGRRSC